MNSQTPLSPADAIEHFDDWQRERAKDNRDRLSERSAQLYRYVWKSWLRYLGGVPFQGEMGVPWRQATAEHVQTFLDDAVAPSSARRSPSSPISPVTRQRYQRLLERVYQHAVNKHLIHANPLREEVAASLPLEDVDGQVFNLVQWRAIKAAFPEGDSRWAVRNRALLSLLMDLGLTTSEVCDLRLDALGITHVPPVLQINGTRSAQQRTLYPRPQTWKALHAWLQERQSMLARARGSNEWLFVTQKGYPMSPRALFHLAAKTIKTAFLSNGMEVPNHIGPASLRNTRIVMWLNDGVETDEVLKRAGYKDFRSLRYLKAHVRDDQLYLGE